MMEFVLGACVFMVGVLVGAAITLANKPKDKEELKPYGG